MKLLGTRAVLISLAFLAAGQRFPDRVTAAPAARLLSSGGRMGVDRAGNIYIADGLGQGIIKLSPNGKIRAQTHLGFSPSNVVVDRSGIIYTANLDTCQVVKLSRSFKVLARFGTTCGAGPGQFGHGGVVVDSTGTLYVDDYDNGRVRKLSSSGEIVQSWGSLGSGPGQLDGPTGMAVDTHDNLYVVDHHNARVEEFTSSGLLLRTFTGGLVHPQDASVDRSGNVYVTSPDTGEVVVFTPAGTVKARWHITSTPPFPAALTVDARRAVIYVQISDYSTFAFIQKRTLGGKVVETWK